MAKGIMVRCYDCANSTLMQWFRNPIVCQCSAFEERFVAMTTHLCDEFVARPKPVDPETDIAHYDHYED